jgi:hypothetical protein
MLQVQLFLIRVLLRYAPKFCLRLVEGVAGAKARDKRHWELQKYALMLDGCMVDEVFEEGTFLISGKRVRCLFGYLYVPSEGRRPVAFRGYAFMRCAEGYKFNGKFADPVWSDMCLAVRDGQWVHIGD